MESLPYPELKHPVRASFLPSQIPILCAALRGDFIRWMAVLHLADLPSPLLFYSEFLCFFQSGLALMIEVQSEITMSCLLLTSPVLGTKIFSDEFNSLPNLARPLLNWRVRIVKKEEGWAERKGRSALDFRVHQKPRAIHSLTLCAQRITI